MLDFKFFDKLYKDVIPMFRDYIFGIPSGGKGAKDVYGKPYKQYKKKKGISLYSQRKKAGKIKRQEDKFKGSNAPVATGDLYRDFQKRSVSNKGFSFGTVAHGGKVKHLEKLGRVITTRSKPLPDPVVKHIDNSAEKYIKSKIKRNVKGGKFKI